MQIVAIVGGHQRDAGFFREADEVLIDALFDFQALVLNFQEEIPFAENIAQPVGVFARLVELFVDDGFGDRSAQAGGERDEAFAVLGKQVVSRCAACSRSLRESRQRPA